MTWWSPFAWPLFNLNGLGPLESSNAPFMTHRWLNKGTCPTIEEMKKAQVKAPGYQKLQRFAFWSSDYDMYFACSDACRINKCIINIELDKPIRSVFRWYCNSAYLHNPPGSPRTQRMVNGRQGAGRCMNFLHLPRSGSFNMHCKPLTDHQPTKSPAQNLSYRRFWRVPPAFLFTHASYTQVHAV